jgi:hypothetical protein
MHRKTLSAEERATMERHLTEIESLMAADARD